MTEQKLTAKQAAEALGIPYSTFTKAVSRGDGPRPFVIPGSSRKKYLISDLQRWHRQCLNNTDGIQKVERRHLPQAGEPKALLAGVFQEDGGSLQEFRRNPFKRRCPGKAGTSPRRVLSARQNQTKSEVPRRSLSVLPGGNGGQSRVHERRG